MTKTYLSIGLLLILLAGATFWYSDYIQSSSSQLVQELDYVEQLIHGQNWDQANQEMERMQEEWKHTKKWWSAMLNHQEIDQIDITLKRVEKYVEGKSSLLSLGELAALRLLVDHIANTESFSIENIF